MPLKSGTPSTADKVINFQQQVGKVGASFSLIVAYIFAGIMMLAGVLLALTAFVPVAPSDCPDTVNNAQSRVDVMCNGPVTTECKNAQDALTKAKAHCAKKTNHYAMLLFLLLIPLGVGVIYLAKFAKHEVDTNPAWGAVAGTATELQLARDVLRG